MSALSILIDSLGRTPRDLEAAFQLVPVEHWHWTPANWDAVPGEMFSAAGQVCHLRDIEIDGYQVRIRRMQAEPSPDLVSLDSYEIARRRDYAHADPIAALVAFRKAREETVAMLREISPAGLERMGTFAEYGPLTLRALIHYLCSHDQQHLACMQWLLGKIDSHAQVARLGAS